MGREHEETRGKNNQMTRRQLLKRMACGSLALTGAGTALSACAPDPIPTEEWEATPDAPEAPSYYLPTDEGLWKPPAAHKGDLPSGPGTVEIEGVGTYSFEAERVRPVRPDIFQPGHISLFDVLVHVSQTEGLALEYHFDESMETHVIDTLGGERGWWYNAHYSAGWFEPNVFRMDMYPYKNNTRIRLDRENEGRLEAIHHSFREEVDRLRANAGRVIIPDVRIRAPSGRLAFRDVNVTPHDGRTDVLQPGVVTGLDALISLVEQGELPPLKLTWYERIAGADPVDSYWVEELSEDSAVGGCGFVYETGPSSFSGFSGTHIHIPADVRVTISPEYAL